MSQECGMHIRDRIVDTVGAVAAHNERAVSSIRQRNCCWTLNDKRVSDVVALALITAEKEDPVFHDRAAHGSPELLKRTRILRAGIHGVEVVTRIERGVASEGVRRPMEHIGARLQPDIDNGAWLPSVLGG